MIRFVCPSNEYRSHSLAKMLLLLLPTSEKGSDVDLGAAVGAAAGDDSLGGIGADEKFFVIANESFGMLVCRHAKADNEG